MNILVACEESQVVCIAFREKGHNCFSCDIQKCSGGHPEWHIKDDVLPLLNGNCSFITCDGQRHQIKGKWDMIIAHPPCTHLAVSGARHFEKKRADGRQKEAIKFFKYFLDCDCDRVCIENPVGIIGGEYIDKWFPEFSGLRKPTQIIQPYEYGHKAKKTTCLWLKGLPNLTPTEIVEPEFKCYVKKDGSIARFSKDYGPGDANAGYRRSRTYTGVARAMADQWG